MQLKRKYKSTHNIVRTSSQENSCWKQVSLVYLKCVLGLKFEHTLGIKLQLYLGISLEKIGKIKITFISFLCVNLVVKHFK